MRDQGGTARPCPACSSKRKQSIYSYIKLSLLVVIPYYSSSLTAISIYSFSQLVSVPYDSCWLNRSCWSYPLLFTIVNGYVNNGEILRF